MRFDCASFLIRYFALCWRQKSKNWNQNLLAPFVGTASLPLYFPTMSVHLQGDDFLQMAIWYRTSKGEPPRLVLKCVEISWFLGLPISCTKLLQAGKKECQQGNFDFHSSKYLTTNIQAFVFLTTPRLERKPKSPANPWSPSFCPASLPRLELLSYACSMLRGSSKEEGSRMLQQFTSQETNLQFKQRNDGKLHPFSGERRTR